jgi:glycosyltransferase involved in cell wall biosynthesis
MKISVVITTKNAEKYIEDLLKSMMNQEKPYEIIIVDSDSTDNTQKIIKEYSKKNKNIKLFIHPGTRSESMNYGIKQATGDAVAFIGGDDVPDANWVREIRKALKNADIVCGKLISKEENRFKTLQNVKIFHNGVNISYPGTNTTYKKEILDRLGGLDPWFSSAEDLELNYRAVDIGYEIQYDENAIVYYRPRNSLFAFLKQSFDYGHGRKLLALKYKDMWKKYSVSDTLKTQFSLLGIMRLSLGFIGYLYCTITVREYKTNH